LLLVGFCEANQDAYEAIHAMHSIKQLLMRPHLDHPLARRDFNWNMKSAVIIELKNIIGRDAGLDVECRDSNSANRIGSVSSGKDMAD
jgi:hypothetical protein